MPIDDLQTNEYGFPEAGRIRLGIKKVNDKGVEYPTATDYFVLSDAAELIPFYGQKPRELLVFLPYQERDRNFRAWYELYRSKGLYCQGSGTSIHWAVDPAKGGDIVVADGLVVCPYTEEDGTGHEMGGRVPCSGKNRLTAPLYPRCTECKRRAVLSVMVRNPEQPNALVNNRLAYYAISTSNVKSIIALTESLNFYASAAAAAGKSLPGIPLILRYVEYIGTTRIEKNGETERIKKKKLYLAFEADPRWTAFAMPQLAAGAIDMTIEQTLLVSGESDDVIEGDGMYVPEENDEALRRLENKIGDLHAMKDEELPTSWEAYHDILGEVMEKYSPTDFIRAVREQMGIGRNKQVSLDKDFWRASLDLVIEILSGKS
jgi:hypothetical protein